MMAISFAFQLLWKCSRGDFLSQGRDLFFLRSQCSLIEDVIDLSSIAAPPYAMPSRSTSRPCLYLSSLSNSQIIIISASLKGSSAIGGKDTKSDSVAERTLRPKLVLLATHGRHTHKSADTYTH
ncbi:hypothetical protein P8452_62485 [Trifolium repens]|nr:hypothetical protein QL285_040462 [Trifolium repens]WJX79365.1 hypothetical protein P8452_62485 [Trifolium repens]